MDAGFAPDGLTSCGLPHAWAKQTSWTILDTHFQNGEAFLHSWQAWRDDPQRPNMLHYVGIASDMTGGLSPQDAPETDLHRALAAQCQNLGPGFRRMLFDGGHVSLTLCIGDQQAMLHEHVFQADTIFAGAVHDKWAAQLLARRCKRGTRFCMDTTAPSAPESPQTLTLYEWMHNAGFEWDAAPDPSPTPPTIHTAQRSHITGRFNPRWALTSRRAASNAPPPLPARCAVVGAGISGASVAHALALRGWHVSVFDQENAPAKGASGLPAGLAVPHVSADDSPRSRLSRNGARLLMQHAAHYLVQGQDWEPSGVLERKPDAPPLWHPQAAWIKPTPLVHAWLAHPSIHFSGQTQVSALHREGELWNLLDSQQQSLGSFELVVVANAMGCTALLHTVPPDVQPGPYLQDKLDALQAVHGTLSHGTYAEPIANLPATPVNGNGCFLPHVSAGAGKVGEQWVLGSSFETDALAAADIWAHHAANLARLPHLLPELARDDDADLAKTLDRGPVSLWSSTRCVPHDRLPLVGPVNASASDGLWLCVGMGSRGLSFAALCAELLVARLGQEPLPVEFSLSRSLDVHRTRRTRTALRLFEANQPPGVD